MFQIHNPIIPLVVLFCVVLPGISFISFLLGRKIGQTCQCCGFTKNCQPCYKFKCPNAERHLHDGA